MTVATVSRHETIAAFRSALDAERRAGRVVGLVPTMGYLHEGHASLLLRAAAETDIAAATIFVNPLQFAPTEDLAAYPRDLDRDLALLAECGITHAFVPPVDEMYPDGAAGVLTTVTVDGPSRGLEGDARPTHFAGVATVVAKLFNIAGPCRAYFGEKDWQQLEVVRRMVRDLSVPVEVVGCATVREPDGLAMSSRNAYLDADQRRAAAVLHRALLAARPLAAAGDHDAARAAMRSAVAAEPLATLDYADIRDGRLLIAARIGPARLIDNIPIEGD